MLELNYQYRRYIKYDQTSKHVWHKYDATTTSISQCTRYILTVGDFDGASFGLIEEPNIGDFDGDFEGAFRGLDEGDAVGDLDGLNEGDAVGDLDGLNVGD